MAIHTLSIGGTSFTIQPKYASSAGYAATAGGAMTASFSVIASDAFHASSASYANEAGKVSNSLLINVGDELPNEDISDYYEYYDGSEEITIESVAHAKKANYASSASYATTAGRSVTAGSAITASRSMYAASASNAVTAAHAVTAGMSKATWTNVSTSTFYIAGSTTSTSGSNTLVKNTNVKVQSNALYASAGFYESSDARLKTITNDVEVDFERLKSIPKIQYIKKGDTAPHIGTIAQDLQKVYPEFVETGEDGYMSVDYAKLSIIPLKAVDILYDEVNKLKNEIKIVKEENQMLKNRLDNIESIINK